MASLICRRSWNKEKLIFVEAVFFFIFLLDVSDLKIRSSNQCSSWTHITSVSVKVVGVFLFVIVFVSGRQRQRPRLRLKTKRQ